MGPLLKPALLVGLLVGSISLPGCDVNPFDGDDVRDVVGSSDFVAEEFFSFERNAASYTSLRLESVNGTIDITGTADTNRVVITGERRVGSSSTEDAEAHLRDLEVRITEPGNELFIKTIQPQSSRGRNYIVNYRIFLPGDYDLTVGHINGPVDLRGMSGDAYVDLINGQIVGRLSPFENTTIDMTTVNGAVRLDVPRATSAEVSANVTNGNISVSNLEIHERRSTRSSLQGTLGDGRGLIFLRTVNGNIRLSGF